MKDTKIGVIFKLLATLCATLMLACVKGLEGEIPTGEVIFFRSFVALFPLIIWLHNQGGIKQNIYTRNVFGHFIRGMSGTGGMYFNYLALAYISLADATAISYSAPLFTVIMAVLLLKERVTWHRWLGIALGIFGIGIMMLPLLNASSSLFNTSILSGGNTASIGVIFALCGAFCAATSNVQIRFLAQKEKPGAIVFYFSIMTTFIGLSTVFWGWALPSITQLLLLIGCGLFGGLAQILVTLSLRYSDASLLAPFDYTTLVWSTILGFIIWDHLPTYSTVLGASIIAISGLYIVWQDNYLHRRTKKRSLT
ncbi:DMT family transporter [Vibrio viridaestus]|uniref:DMT family transporter n=1 Tax=Vibrio viridaestus TaxID=2487322 RepID=A0A3N9TWA9_9VIBR|nr:DMT family transporter [Vibrio viridaestus]RQW61202.1 DMT family transporter [Vibrio viridaestus]